MPAQPDLKPRDTDQMPDGPGGVADVIPISPGLRERARTAMRPLAERASEPPVREMDKPEGLPCPQWRSPLSEDQPSPRCRIADSQKGAEIFGAWYYLLDAIPLLINICVVKPADLATQRPARFWGLAILVITFILLQAT